MKALFCTTNTVDCLNHVRAWNSFAPRAEHVTFDHYAVRNEGPLLEAALTHKPDVIFYIGAYKAPGNPTWIMFRALREIAPSINIVSDAADPPWHPVLQDYRERECFDLQVAIDGANTPYVDFSTLTPIDPVFFSETKRVYRCGFSGTLRALGRRLDGSFRRVDKRGKVLMPLVDTADITLRNRGNSYRDHAAFMSSCRMTINTHFTGSGVAGHVKGRVLEAGWAGCALLEPMGSPVFDWFPTDAVLGYRNRQDAQRMIRDLSDAEIDKAAGALSACVRKRYTAARIYGDMIERIGLDVGASVQRPAA